jgi:hypothetical protein
LRDSATPSWTPLDDVLQRQDADKLFRLLDAGAFTSISRRPVSSWLNQVARWFGLITDKMIRRGTFHSVDELERAIYAWLANWNDAPKPFVWKATADVILDTFRGAPLDTGPRESNRPFQFDVGCCPFRSLCSVRTGLLDGRCRHGARRSQRNMNRHLSGCRKFLDSRHRHYLHRSNVL